MMQNETFIFFIFQFRVLLHLTFFKVPHHMSDFRKLSVMTVDAALSLFDGQFLTETLLGSDLADGAEVDKESGLLQYTAEVVAALCGSLLNGRNGPFGRSLCLVLVDIFEFFAFL